MVSITKFRQDLFNQVERALNGENVEFIHKGVVFRVIPETRMSKLSRLTAQRVVNEDLTTHPDLFKQMEAEWEQDWTDI
jgi:predicted site-specific integrase-resolvase